MLIEKLEQVERGAIKRLMVFMPPRHGKSLTANCIFPAWFLGRNPKRSVIAASYGAELAEDFGRRVRNIMMDPLHAAIFPDGKLSADSAAQRRFDTSAGGSYYAVGRGGAVTGRGANLLLLDDLLKDSEEARPITFGELAKDYIRVELVMDQSNAAIPKAHSTVETYRRYINKHVLPRWEPVRASDMEPIAVQNWLRELHKDSDLSNSTQVKIRNVMVAIFKHAQRYGFLPRTQEANPMLFVRPFKPPRPR